MQNRISFQTYNEIVCRLLTATAANCFPGIGFELIVQPAQREWLLLQHPSELFSGHRHGWCLRLFGEDEQSYWRLEHAEPLGYRSPRLSPDGLLESDDTLEPNPEICVLAPHRRYFSICTDASESSLELAIQAGIRHGIALVRWDWLY